MGSLKAMVPIKEAATFVSLLAGERDTIEGGVTSGTDIDATGVGVAILKSALLLFESKPSGLRCMDVELEGASVAVVSKQFGAVLHLMVRLFN